MKSIGKKMYRIQRFKMQCQKKKNIKKTVTAAHGI